MRRALLALGLALGLAVPPAHAQFAVGGQAGSLGGATLRLPARTPVAFVLDVALDGAEYLTAGLHVYAERAIPASPLHVYAAPGVFGGTRDGLAFRRTTAGARVHVGTGYYAGRFEVFLQATPGLRVEPQLSPFVYAAVGLRYAL